RASPRRDLTSRSLVLGGASTVAASLGTPLLPGAALSTLAPALAGGSPHPLDAPRPARAPGRGRPRSGLEELQGLDVEQRGRSRENVRVAQRLEKLPRSVEVVHPNPNRAEPLRDVRIRPGPGDDPVLRREPHCLLVEGTDRHPRIEHLD